MKKRILSMLLLLVCTTMAWAQTAPEGLSIDTDYNPGDEGYYYVNMPSLSSIEFTSTDLVFKVYDNGGKNGIADKDGKLQLKAPVGYCFEIEVTIVGLDEDALEIYNSSLSEATPNKQLYGFYGQNSGGTYNQLIGTYRTTDNWMYITFLSQSDLAGFELTVRIKPLLRGQGTEEKPYEIYYSDAWDLLCTNVAAGETYEGKYFKQMADFTITQGVGTDDYAFSGHYDGNKHELACAISAADQMAAPFCRVNGAEIKDLHVTGSVATSMTDGADHTAGLIGKAAGNVTVNNVRVSATVTGLTYYGGFIGHGGNNSTINMTGCVFDGALTEKTTGETQHTGGFIGWGDNMTITMSNCLFDGTSTIGTGGSGAKTFHPVGYHSIANDASVTLGLTNVYYTVAPSASQSSPNLGVAISNGNEKQAYTISTTDANVTALAMSGDVANYTVSGLKGYAAGIEYGSTLYAGSGDEVNLTLAHADAEAGQHFSSYAVSGGGSLTAQTETSATLSMTDANQTISAEYADNPSHNVSFVITETGWSTTPSGTAREGETVTVSYTGKNKVKYVVVKPNDAPPSAASQIEMTGTKTDDTYSYSGTFTMGTNNMDVSNALYYKLGAEETLADYQATYNNQVTYEYKYYFLDRMLTKGVWNTFVSPFAIASGDMEKYFGAGAKVRKLDSTTIDEGNILTLNFVNANSIEAGKPYIVKPTAANVDFSDDGKEFEGVNLSPASASPDNTTYVNFVPTVGKTTVTGNVEDILMMTIEGKLVHPTKVGDMKGFRGYFVMHDATAARAFRIDFGDGESTGIIPIRMENGSTKADGMTFDLQGRKIAQPKQRGIYIQNGKKVIVK